MNVLEGSRRMQKAGRTVLLVSASAFVLLIVLFEAWVYLRDVVHPDILAQELVQFVFFTVPVVVGAILVGAALWLAGWIMEGFAKHDAT